MGPEYEVERKCSIYKGGVEIAKFEGNMENWIQKPGWTALAVGDWNEFLKKCAAA